MIIVRSTVPLNLSTKTTGSGVFFVTPKKNVEVPDDVENYPGFKLLQKQGLMVVIEQTPTVDPLQKSSGIDGDAGDWTQTKGQGLTDDVSPAIKALEDSEPYDEAFAEFEKNNPEDTAAIEHDKAEGVSISDEVEKLKK